MTDIFRARRKTTNPFLLICSSIGMVITSYNRSMILFQSEPLYLNSMDIMFQKRMKKTNTSAQSSSSRTVVSPSMLKHSTKTISMNVHHYCFVCMELDGIMVSANLTCDFFGAN